MKRIVTLSIFALAIALLPTGGVSAQSKRVHETLLNTQAPTDCDPNGGADRYAGRGNNPRSHCYRHADYHHLRSNDTLLYCLASAPCNRPPNGSAATWLCSWHCNTSAWPATEQSGSWL